MLQQHDRLVTGLGEVQLEHHQVLVLRQQARQRDHDLRRGDLAAQVLAQRLLCRPPAAPGRARCSSGRRNCAHSRGTRRPAGSRHPPRKQCVTKTRMGSRCDMLHSVLWRTGRWVARYDALKPCDLLVYNIRYATGTGPAFHLPVPGAGYLRSSRRVLPQITEFITRRGPGRRRPDRGRYRLDPHRHGQPGRAISPMPSGTTRPTSASTARARSTSWCRSSASRPTRSSPRRASPASASITSTPASSG